MYIVSDNGPSKARRSAKKAAPQQFTTADQAAEFFAKYADEEREMFVALFLDGKRNIISEYVVSIGTISQTLVHPREVFRPAIAAGASAIVVGHNHPSGVPTPSPDDVAMTYRLVEAGHLLGIDVLDHIIVARGGKYKSLRGLGFIGREDI